ncbi:MAG: hypothetical protein FWB79_03725, partial [Treponema sp.]|nr:hypothetical protein [Treponema sp.]
VVTCTGFEKDEAGNVTAVRCIYDPGTKSGSPGTVPTQAPEGRKVKGTIHWVSAAGAVSLEARLYGHLFDVERPMEVAPRPDGTPGEFTDNLSPNSLDVIPNAWGEPCLADAKPGEYFQFERLGYFTRDPDTGEGGRPVFNKTVGLRDTWAKIANKGNKGCIPK